MYNTETFLSACVLLSFRDFVVVFFFSVTLPFVISPDTGYINVSSRLDREQQAKYILTVEVMKNAAITRSKQSEAYSTWCSCLLFAFE